MTITTQELADRPGPIYRALADALADAMTDGRLPPGERLPPQRDLAWRLEVTVGTVGRAYDLLIQRGLVRGEVGRGTFVLAQVPAADRAPLVREPEPGVIDLSNNAPIPGAMPPAMGEVLMAAASDANLPSLLAHYAPAIGHARHRAAGAAWLQQLGVEQAASDSVIITAGVQSGLAAALSALARPGDPVLLEAITYGGIRRLAQRLGLRPEPLPADEEGVLPDALEATARATGAKLAVLSPTLSNPTLSLMSLERRRAVAEVARRTGLRVVEDDVYGPLLADRPPPLAALLPELTVYITSVSKFLAPGLRLGVLCAPSELAMEIAGAVSELALANPPFSAEIFKRCLEAGLLDIALERQRGLASARYDLARRLLAGTDLVSHPEALHVWLRLPPSWAGYDFSLALARDGVVVTPGDRFAVARGAPPRAVRISLSAAADERILEIALQRVANLLARPAPHLAHAV